VLLTALALSALLPGVAWAQSTGQQVWADFTADFRQSDRFLYELDVQPKAQVSGDDTWRALEATPAFEWLANRWFEVVGQTLLSRTRQSTDVTTYEVAPRIGLRLHLFSNLRTMRSGPRPLRRVGIANLLRLEWRNLWYSDGTPTSHQWRLRNRIELKAGINHGDMSRDGTLYFQVDVEVFMPLNGNIDETYASKLRGRIGLGYRHSDTWRYGVLYIRDETRQSAGDIFARSANSVDFRVQTFF
jgi:hypothetical protein